MISWPTAILIQTFDDEHGNFGAAKPYTASASLPLTRSVWRQHLDPCALHRCVTRVRASVSLHLMPAGDVNRTSAFEMTSSIFSA